MFEKITPEQAGISSKIITNFIDMLEDRGASTHGMLFMKDGKIFAEGYWSPFHKDFCHRMYSQTKSFVGVAIGLLEEEGKLSLDDRIVDYFPEKIDGEISPRFNEQTIRDMLMMCTLGGSSKWFGCGDKDRTHLYFNEYRKGRVPGALWAYDSPGSQVLSSLVEKLSGKTLLDYLKEKLFNHIGAFKTAKILKTPNGDSWGDSAMVCTLRDMAVFGQFVMNYGVWEGKRLMNEKYLREATSKLTANVESAHFGENSYGYGYQIWRVRGNGFAFIGMGDQLTVCYPDKNLIFAYMSDNQGTGIHRQNIFAYLRTEVLKNMQDGPIEKDDVAYAELEKKISKLKLRHVDGIKDVELRKEINGVKYVASCDNAMGIKDFSLMFNGDEGEFRYTNAQGYNVIPFGINKNVFGKFPQLGYSSEYGDVPTTDGFMYNDAVSFTWLDHRQCILFVQIIDEYFANMSAVFAFKGDEVVVSFSKTAEAFLEEYQGVLIAHKE
ncbi:MAG: serine hydrolase [Clostridia bacterium]|nr:serine hydrolase [Clostridia bacterium]